MVPRRLGSREEDVPLPGSVVVRQFDDSVV